MNFRRPWFGLIALVALGFVAAGVATSGGATAPSTQVAQTAPTTTPSAGGPRRGRRREPGTPGPSPTPSPTESPVPLQFSSLDGVWEVELQPYGKRPAYSHLDIVQTGSQLTGYWQHEPGKQRSPLTGTFDGRLFSITIDLGAGKTASMAGYCENFSDFVGMLRTTATDDGTPFTAQHRKKERPQ